MQTGALNPHRFSVARAGNPPAGYFQAFRRWPSGQYMKTIAKQLNGRVNTLRALGRHATWYVPTVLGLYSVYDAPPEMRVRTLFEEGFGVVGGWAGTIFGAEVVGAGLVAILGLGPLGAFVAIFVCASVFGVLGNELFKRFGNRVYEIGERSGDQIYHSLDELIGVY